jgi:hypothetical protein
MGLEGWRRADDGASAAAAVAGLARRLARESHGTRFRFAETAARGAREPRLGGVVPKRESAT